MKIPDSNSQLLKVGGKILGGSFGKCGDEDSFFANRSLGDFVEEIVNLSFEGSDDYRRIDKPRGANDEFDYGRVLAKFPWSWGGGHANDLVLAGKELFEIEGSIVEGRRKSKPEIHEDGFSRSVSCIHPADLRNGRMGLVDDGKKVFGKEVEERVGGRAGGTPGQMPGVIFNAVAETHFLHHFEIVIGTHLEPLGLEKFVFFFKLLKSRFKFSFNGEDCALDFFVGGDEVLGGEKNHGVLFFEGISRERFE
jgi:hypothetical protein